MSAARRDLAEQKALELHLQHPEYCSIPVNPIRVANGLGLRVLRDNSEENIDGWYNSVNKTIYLNTDQPLYRRRFTVAHELGHHIMGHKTRPRDRSKQYTKEDFDPDEVEANRFAAALLMPEAAVRKCVFEKGMLVEAMADFFGVSEKAMCIRLKQLRIVK